MNQDNKNEEKNSCQQEPETAEDAVKAPETENEEHMENQRRTPETERALRRQPVTIHPSPAAKRIPRMFR